jgi:hypothetical protein
MHQAHTACAYVHTTVVQLQCVQLGEHEHTRPPKAQRAYGR